MIRHIFAIGRRSHGTTTITTATQIIERMELLDAEEQTALLATLTDREFDALWQQLDATYAALTDDQRESLWQRIERRMGRQQS